MIHIRRSSRISSIATFAGGVGIGLGLAMLLAPCAGRESQEWLAEKAREGVGDLKSTGHAVQERASGAIQAGKDAYREATSDSPPRG